jgi:uncharacterized DUF497 family protein
VQITFDPEKRAKTLIERGLDFARATEVFAGHHFTAEDIRTDYNEKRLITFGYLDARMIVMVWTIRAEERRIISMRKANEREKAKYGHYLDRRG